MLQRCSALQRLHVGVFIFVGGGVRYLMRCLLVLEKQPSRARRARGPGAWEQSERNVRLLGRPLVRPVEPGR